MPRDDSERVREIFAASAHHCTPAPARHAAKVLFAPASSDPEVSQRCASVLSDAELRKADTFLTEDLKARFTQQRAFRRYCGALVSGSGVALSQIVFETSQKGRPYLPDLPGCWFSFSSCRVGYLAAWSSTHRIGVDIEDQTKQLEAAALAQKYFSKTEARAVAGTGELACVQTFFQLWTLKEAALKSIGEGLPFGLDAFEFELTPNLRVVHAPGDHGGPERFSAHVIEGADSCAALVIREGRSRPLDQADGGGRRRAGREAEAL